MRKQIVEVREGMRDRLIASKRNRMLLNRKIKRDLDKDIKKKLKAKEKEMKAAGKNKVYNHMMVLLARQNAKLNVNKIQKMKKFKISKILQEEKELQEKKQRKMDKIYKKRIEFMQGIE